VIVAAHKRITKISSRTDQAKISQVARPVDLEALQSRRRRQPPDGEVLLEANKPLTPISAGLCRRRITEVDVFFPERDESAGASRTLERIDSSSKEGSSKSTEAAPRDPPTLETATNLSAHVLRPAQVRFHRVGA